MTEESAAIHEPEHGQVHEADLVAIVARRPVACTIGWTAEDWRERDSRARLRPPCRRTNAGVFASLQARLSDHDVLVQDAAWDHLQGEDDALLITLSFSFELPEPT